MKNIPIHSFQIDDESSISFKLIELTKEGTYDTSVPHRHNYYEVFIFEIGGGYHNIDFKTHEIKNHSIHFVSPGQVHNVVREIESKGFVMLFSRDFYSRNHNGLRKFPFLNNNSADYTIDLSADKFQILYELINQINLEQNSRDTLSDQLILAHLNTFLAYCSRYFKEINPEKVLVNDSLSFRYRQLIEKLYLEKHNVSHYADLLNVSEKQLASATKKELGVTPKEILYDRIVLEAKRLVSFTSYSFQEIAFFLSYTDASHFAKFFKNQTGSSPKEYRKKYTN